MTRLDKTKVGGYVKLIGRIAWKSISPFIVILILLCGFLEAFRNRSVYKGHANTSSFDTISNFNVSFEYSIFQVYSFMVGNLQANEMGVDNLTWPNLVTFVIYFTFIFLISSLAFNIFTGIAINEIQSLIKDCNIQIMKDKIDYIYGSGHSVFECLKVFDRFQGFEKFEKRFFQVVAKVYKINSLVEKMVHYCRKEKAAKILISRETAETGLHQEPAESALNQLDFVHDKYSENFETLEDRTKNLELRLEDRTKELEDKLDLILSCHNILPENSAKSLEDRLESRIKELKDKLDLILNHKMPGDRISNLELKLNERTKKLEDKLKNRSHKWEDKLNTILEKLEQLTIKK